MFQDNAPAHDTASSGLFKWLSEKLMGEARGKNDTLTHASAHLRSHTALKPVDDLSQTQASLDSSSAAASAAQPDTQTVIKPIEALAETVGTATRGTGSARLHFIAKDGAPHVNFTYNNQSQIYPLNQDQPDVNTRQIAEIKKFVDTIAPDFLAAVNNPVKLTRADGQKHLFMNIAEVDHGKAFEWDPAIAEDIEHSIETHNVLLAVNLKGLMHDPANAVGPDTQIQPAPTPTLSGAAKGLT